MLKTIFFSIRQRFSRDQEPKNTSTHINERTRLKDLLATFPKLQLFLETRYRIPLSEQNLKLNLHELVKTYGFASPQIFFMELQLFHRDQNIRSVSARDVERKLAQFEVLDVREPWERKMGALPRSRDLDENLMREILTKWKKDRPILIYCHFGIRSQDASAYLMEQGFSEVYVLKGGIDAWSKEIDPSIPQYEQAWC